jgi:hypothetical protein
MGLDQYAYAIDNNGEKEELAYWRKHPSLHGWMEDLWESKGSPGRPEAAHPVGLSVFNCVPVPLSHEDIDSLERAVKTNMLPETQGFFFGDDSSDHYRAADLEFIQKAREALDAGLDVFYDSWW